jgi:hypothetical protein
MTSKRYQITGWAGQTPGYDRAATQAAGYYTATRIQTTSKELLQIGSRAETNTTGDMKMVKRVSMHFL